jgi:hypothetical protein
VGEGRKSGSEQTAIFHRVAEEDFTAKDAESRRGRGVNESAIRQDGQPNANIL